MELIERDPFGGEMPYNGQDIMFVDPDDRYACLFYSSDKIEWLGQQLSPSCVLVSLTVKTTQNIFNKYRCESNTSDFHKIYVNVPLAYAYQLKKDDITTVIWAVGSHTNIRLKVKCTEDFDEKLRPLMKSFQSEYLAKMTHTVAPCRIFLMNHNIIQPSENPGLYMWGKNGFISVEYFLFLNNLSPEEKQYREKNVLLLCLIHQLSQ